MNPTRTTIGVPRARHAAIAEFLRLEGLDWNIVEPPGGDIVIVEAPPKSECSTGTLHPGGRIPCALALALAASTGVSGKSVGRLLNELEIKVRDCQLGCFP